MVHVGISRWREQWIAQHGASHRVPGVWDPALERETLVLSDGRHLMYFLDGPSDRTVPHIFVLHAMFLSGNSFLMAEPPTDYVLVCVNRPGYFGSDLPTEATTMQHHRNNDNDDDSGLYEDASYSYKSFAHDMEQLARHLQLREFYVAGHSSGGPCALACAAHLPRRQTSLEEDDHKKLSLPRVAAVGLLSSDPEYAHANAPNKRWINAFCIGTVLPWVLNWLLCCLPLARQARRGVQNDYRLETSLYSFCTESDVTQPVLIYAGERDNVLPVDISQSIHARIPHAEFHIVPGAGHLCLLRDDVLRDFFESLIAMGQRHEHNGNDDAEDNNGQEEENEEPGNKDKTAEAGGKKKNGAEEHAIV